MAEVPLGQVATRGALMLGASQLVRIVTSFGSSIFVARLLTPADYGVVAMVAPVTGFILIFQNLGLNQGVIQRPSLSARQINGVFWVNGLATLAIALLFVAIAPLLGRFYDDERVVPLMAASAFTVVIGGMATQHLALLNRHMRFGALSLVEMTSAVTGLLATILLAWWLRDYWALFLGPLVGMTVGGIIAWWSEPWRPSLRRLDLAATQPLLSMGADITGSNLLNFISRNLDNLLIARRWGAGQLGLYDRSYRLMLFPIQTLNQPLGRVMLPALSRSINRPEAFRGMYLLALRALVLVIVPGAIALSLCSSAVIVLLLGEQWRAAGPIFAWLGLTAAVQSISNATGWLFVSSGRTRALVRWGVISATMTIASFFIGLPWGAVGVAAAYAVSEIIRIPLLYRMCSQDTPVSAGDHYDILLPSLLGAGACTIVVSIIRDSLEPLPLLCLAIVLAYVLATGAQLATASGRAALIRLFGLLRDLRGRGRLQPSANQRM